MANVVGITGQIGAGKSVVLKVFSALYDIPVFDCDKVAKEVYFIPTVRENIQSSLGFDPINSNGQLRKSRITDCLKQFETRKRLEKIVHAAIRQHFASWKEQQSTPWVALESAILFTSGMYQLCDVTIAVQADSNVRKQRVLDRDDWRDAESFELIEGLQKLEAIRQSAEANIFITNNNEKVSIIRELERVYNQLNNIFQRTHNETN